MDAAMSDSMYQKYYEEFKNLTKNSEEFLQQNSTNSEEFLHIAKFFHDHVIQCNSLTALKSKSLPRLLIKGFDDEQILQQLEIQNKSAFSHFDSELSKFDLETLSFNANSPTENDFDDALPVSEEEANGASESEEHDDEDLVSDDDSEDNMESNNANLESNACKNKKREIEESESDPEDRIESNKRQKKSKKSGYKSIVDDQFFKLSNLEQFLRLEDLKEEKARDGELDESDEDEEIDLFQDIPSDYMDESDNENKKSSIDLMYEDFFDAPDSGDDENVENSDKMLDVEKEKYNYNKNYTNQGESENDDDELQENETNIPSKKTPFELQKENINKTIAEYEESMVKPKPWQLTGEVDKRNRPRDGLLDVQTDFVINEKPAIVQDAEFCEKIEKLIKMTKKNKAYSDGVRKEKPKEVITHKKEIVLEQTKSKKGLAEVYEDMYLQKKSNQEEKENPKHTQIKKFMDSLLPHLYALFSHIPKPAVPDIKIVSNLPAITVEEVAPTSYSDIALLAPEEVKKRTGVIKGQTERTETDRKRERRKKKVHQKIKQKKEESKNSDEKPLSRKAKKQEKLNILKKLKQNRNTKIANMEDEKIKSSKDFFERLQETVATNVSRKELMLKMKKKK